MFGLKSVGEAEVNLDQRFPATNLFVSRIVVKASD
jgi:hypothetical protein